jgi:hypothetical protein
VYRTTDGGKTWKNVLFCSETLRRGGYRDPAGNPRVVFASRWHAQRKPGTIVSSAREGGIYKSTDGGETWNKLAGGLPGELFGRSNVAISAANPNRIYALIEAKPGAGLYRSENGGSSWTLVNGSGSIITRPFYYTTLGVDPDDANVVWVGDEGWFKSTDGGKTFRSSPVPHGDNHDVWINPRNSQYMIQGNYGGANVSLDGGRAWSTQANQPTAEIYQVAVDDQYPYRVYGAHTTVIAQPAAGQRAGLPRGAGMRNRADHSRQGRPGDRLRRLQGPVQPAKHKHHRRGALLGRGRIALRQRRQRVDVPLPARIADGGVTVCAAHGLLRVASRNGI